MSQVMAEPVARLIEELTKLPTIGPKTAQRLTFYLLRQPKEEVRALAEAILALKEQVIFCSVCCNIADQDPCRVCQDPQRDRTKLCVVEEPLDVLAIERTGVYRGLYHVLHGAISPIEGVGPEQLRIQELLQRVRTENPDEVILATNLDLPGEATATFLHRLLVPLGVNVTRPASGLPVGGDLEYADEITLGRALAGRRAL